MNNKLIIPANYKNLKNQFKQKWKELTADNLEDLNLSKLKHPHKKYNKLLKIL